MITITGGHGDFRQRFEVPRVIGGPLSRMEQIGGSMIADSPDEVRVRVREQLMLGASQIKLTAGGGVASPHSPLDIATFTEPELRAAVEAADNWGTYVTVHAYTPRAIQMAIAAGVKVIEHGHLMDEATAQLMAQKGIWLSIQPFLDDEDLPNVPPGSEARMQQVITGTDTAYAFAKKYKLKTAWGTDVLFSPALARRQGAQLAKLVRWYTPSEVLKMAHGRQRAIAGVERPAQSLSRQARRRRRRRARRPSACRRQSGREHQTDRRPGEKFSRHHEGREDLQEHGRALGCYGLHPHRPS